MYLFSDYNGVANVTDLSIEEWNGALPSDLKSAIESFEPDSEQLLFLLGNGDIVESELESFSNGEFYTKSALGEVTVPLANTKEVSFARLPYYEAKRNKGDVKILLVDESEMTLRLDQWEDGKIFGVSQNIGEAEVKLPHVSEVKFNLYRD